MALLTPCCELFSMMNIKLILCIGFYIETGVLRIPWAGGWSDCYREDRSSRDGHRMNVVSAPTLRTRIDRAISRSIPPFFIEIVAEVSKNQSILQLHPIEKSKN